MAQETAAGHLPRHHKDIGKAIRNGLIAATMLGGIAAGAVAVKNVIEKDSPSYHIITSEKFPTLPPLRLPDLSSQNVTTNQLPSIDQYTRYAEGGNYDNFNPGIDFRLEERPSVEINVRTPDGGTKKDIRRIFPYIIIDGYLIQKELNPDGSVMLAVEIPGKDGLFTQDDIDKAPLSLDESSEDGNSGKLNGAIVWLKLESVEGLTGPFSYSSAWYEDDRLERRSNRTTNIPEEMFKHVRIGDPIFAGAYNGIDSFTQQQLEENYLNQQGPLPYDEARKRWQELISRNASALQQTLDDVKTGNVTLEQQLKEKRYVFEVHSADFLPRTS